MALLKYKSFSVHDGLAAQESYILNLASAALFTPDNRQAVAEILADYAEGGVSIDEAEAELLPLIKKDIE